MRSSMLLGGLAIVGWENADAGMEILLGRRAMPANGLVRVLVGDSAFPFHCSDALWYSGTS